MISGDDDSAIQSEAERIFTRLAGEDPDPFATEIISEDDRGPRAELIGKVLSAIRTPPFLGGNKTIWLKHFTGFGHEPGARIKNDPMDLKRLAEELGDELPDGVFVVLDGPGCDPAKPLVKACSAHGEVIWKNRPNTMKKGWQEEMKGCLAAVAREKGVTLSYEVSELLVDVLGADTSLIEGELEKLICYAGVGNEITPEAVREMCPPVQRPGKLGVDRARGQTGFGGNAFDGGDASGAFQGTRNDCTAAAYLACADFLAESLYPPVYGGKPPEFFHGSQKAFGWLGSTEETRAGRRRCPLGKLQCLAREIRGGRGDGLFSK